MKRPAVFLDRDGTIIEDAGYIGDPDNVRLLPRAGDAIRRLSEAGYLVIVASNQSGLARGLFDEQEMTEVHDRFEELLKSEGAKLDGAYYCPFLDGPEAVVERYRRDSALRKPNPGLLMQAAEELDIDLDQSWMVGNSPTDVMAGRRAECRTILLDPHCVYGENGAEGADSVVSDLCEAVDRILGVERQSPEPEPTSAPAVPTPAEAEEEPDTSEPGDFSSSVGAYISDDEPIADVPTQQRTIPESEESVQLKEILQTLNRIEDQIERAVRRHRQEDFSLLRLGGALLQMAAIVAALWGVAFLFSEQGEGATPRLLLALFLQLASICAFAIDRFR
ncbi:MAG: HAD family hydrolase [Phycisphaerales bacterium]|nr:MAG: HAD family hydrolase [Phycisphaerales bacterium]